MAWFDFWGAYNNAGPYANVALGGGPGATGPFGVNLQPAHNEGRGRGIQFTDDGNYGVTFQLDLIGYAVTDDGRFAGNGVYVDFGGRYKYRLVIHVSNNNQASWREIYSGFIFSHPSNWTLCYNVDWQRTADASKWTGKFQLPRDTTHVRIELMGEDATLPHHNIFSIQQIIPDFKPWAVRRSGRWKSLNNAPKGRFLIRKGGTWQDKSAQSVGDVGKENQGKNRIRKGGKWVGQAQVGE